MSPEVIDPSQLTKMKSTLSADERAATQDLRDQIREAVDHILGDRRQARVSIKDGTHMGVHLTVTKNPTRHHQPRFQGELFSIEEGGLSNRQQMWNDRFFDHFALRQIDKYRISGQYPVAGGLWMDDYEKFGTDFCELQPSHLEQRLHQLTVGRSRPL